MLIKDAKFAIDARKKQLIQQEANALKDAKLRGALVHHYIRCLNYIGTASVLILMTPDSE